MTEATTEGAERFLSDAAARGLDVDVVERPAARSLEEAAGILGISPADIVKSLVVKHRDGSFLFALIPGDRQISWPKLRALVGVNKLSLPPADVALAATGYERGTITPLGQHHPLARVRRLHGHRASHFHGCRGPWTERVRGRGCTHRRPGRDSGGHQRTQLSDS